MRRANHRRKTLSPLRAARLAGLRPKARRRRCIMGDRCAFHSDRDPNAGGGRCRLIWRRCAGRPPTAECGICARQPAGDAWVDAKAQRRWTNVAKIRRFYTPLDHSLCGTSGAVLHRTLAKNPRRGHRDVRPISRRIAALAGQRAHPRGATTGITTTYSKRRVQTTNGVEERDNR